jgi:RNA polymerase sigma-70 factor (ECF subfamily)
MDEKEAIQRLKQDDISGLEFLVQCHQLRAVRAAYLITRDAGLAEDVVQEAFLQVYRSIRSFDGNRSFEPWFMRSVVNASLKEMKRSARNVNIDEMDESLFTELVQSVAPVELQVESLEFQNQVWEAMQKLSPRQRAVVVQRYFLEMSEKEMAAEIGSATGTVKWMLNAAREKLRTLLAERSDE